MEIGRNTDVDLCIHKPLTIGLTKGLDKGLRGGLGIFVVSNNSFDRGVHVVLV